MPAIKVGDINLYYEVHGKGETLVLINGYGSRSPAIFKESQPTVLLTVLQ